MPMPPGFVVKNALNNSLRWSAAMPMPVSCTLISTSSSLSGQERIASSRGRSETEAIAWTAFITRLRTTCWSCTRSPRTGGKSSASRSVNETS